MPVKRPDVDKRLPNASPGKARAKPSLLSRVCLLAVLNGLGLVSCHDASSYYIYTGLSGGGGNANKGGGSGQAGSVEAGSDSGGAGGDATGAGG